MKQIDSIGIFLFKVGFKAKEHKQVTFGILFSLLLGVMWASYTARLSEVEAFEEQFDVVDSSYVFRSIPGSFVRLEGKINGEDYIVYLDEHKLLDGGADIPFYGEKFVAKLKGYISYKIFDNKRQFHNIKVKFYDSVNANGINGFSRRKSDPDLIPNEIQE